jgi:thiol:disulfide interchange protein DsbD
LSEARQAKKPILYDFTADWCAPCQAMKREVFADAAAARQIETLFVPVRVLDRQREEGRNPPEVDSLQQRFHIDSFPTLVVAWPDSGQPTILSGYRGKAMTIQQLSQAVFLRSGLHGSVRFP